MTNTRVFPQTIINPAVQIVNATGIGIANGVTIRTGSANGDKIESIALCTDDTLAHVVTFFVTISAVNYIIGSVNVPITAGTDGVTPAVGGLDDSMLPFLKRDDCGRTYLYLANGAVLKAFVPVILTSGKTLYIFAQGGAY